MNTSDNTPRLAWGAGIWSIGIGLAVLCSLFATFSRGPEQPGMIIPLLLGGVIGAMLLPLLVGWIVWVSRSKRAKGGRVTFLLLMIFSLFAQLSTLAMNSSLKSAMYQLQPVQREWLSTLRTIVADPEFGREDLPQATLRLNDTLTGIDHESLYGDGLNFTLTMIEHHRLLGAEELLLGAELGDFVRANALASSGMDKPGEIDRRIRVVQSLIEASRRYESFQLSTYASIDRNLNTSVSDTAARNQFLTQLKGIHDARLIKIKELTQARVQWCGVMLEWFDHLKRTRQRWTLQNDETFEFSDAADLERFNQLGARVDSGTTIVSKIEEAFAESINAAIGPPPSAPTIEPDA